MFNSYYSGLPQQNAMGQQAPWQPRMPQTMTAYMGEIVKVNGLAGAQSLRLAPNSGLIALDTTAPIVWLCQADGAGYFNPEPFSITPHRAATPENDIEKRLSRLEAMILGDESNAEQHQPRRRRSTESAVDDLAGA